jgi:predicted phage tail protein
MAALASNYQPMTTIMLYGRLRQFGRSFRMAVSTPAEAVKSLCVQLPGFERFLSNAKSKGLEFAVFRGKTNLTEKELGFTGEGAIRIAPVITGSKRGGVLQTIIGAVLIVVGLVITGYAFGSAKNTTASGNPVPLCYGKRRVGGAIISAAIYAEDQM